MSQEQKPDLSNLPPYIELEDAIDKLKAVFEKDTTAGSPAHINTLTLLEDIYKGLGTEQYRINTEATHKVIEARQEQPKTLEDLELLIQQWYKLNNYGSEEYYYFEIETHLNRKRKSLYVRDGTCNVPSDIADKMNFHAETTKEMIEKAFDFFESSISYKQKEIIRKETKKERE